MSHIAGVVTQKNNLGEITHVTIDVKKHGAIIIPVLEKLGLVEKSKLQQKLESDTWLTVEESRQRSIDFVNSLPWKK